MNKWIQLTFLLCTVLFLSQCVLDKEAKKPQEVQSTGVPSVDMATAAIQKSPQDASLYINRAEAYIENKAYEYAIPDIMRAIQLDSLNPQYYHLLSDAQMDNLQSRESLVTMMRVGSMYPNRTATQLKLAETQLILQQYDGALSTINRILKYDPQNAEAYFMLGLTMHEQDENDRAYNAFLTAVENDPELIDAWFMLGRLAEAKKDPQALTYYENALRVKPNSIQAMHSLAYYLQNNGDIPKAQSLYKKIHVLDKDYFQANLNSGILYIEQDSLIKAMEQFNIIVDRHPTNHLGYYYRGVVHELNGDHNSALTDYQTSVNMNDKYEKAVTAAEAMRKALESGKAK